jgi:TetR/AcrR family transcriptional regulator, regulator of autoinduction and epiphytic fitness
MNDAQIAHEILTVFAQYGFKKTSMEDIAHAAGLSRQSIYNRFGSKEAVFDWMVQTFTTEMFYQVTSVLSAKRENPLETLGLAYDAWIGNHVPLWSGTGHGAEIIDLAIASATRAASNKGDVFAKSVAVYILASGLAQDQATAENKTFVLNLASKGLLLIATTTDDYSLAMRRVISTTLE